MSKTPLEKIFCYNFLTPSKNFREKNFYQLLYKLQKISIPLVPFKFYEGD
ncbi:MAG: hypothetical protein IJR94_02550 [Synergistaceae bacterium]|nr:hypothetical protein [Synergistaceae bacterium]